MIKVSKRQITQHFKNIIGVPYYKAENLLYFEKPLFLIKGTYDKDCNVYYFIIDNQEIAISTGHIAIHNKRCKYDLLDNAENMAKMVIKDNSIDLKTKEKKVKEILLDFIRKVMNGC